MIIHGKDHNLEILLQAPEKKMLCSYILAEMF